MPKKFRFYALHCTAVLALTPALAYAQTTETPETGPAAKSDDSEIVVTGSRIKRDGYDAPVPVSVLGAADITAQKPANITDIVYTLPAVNAGQSAIGSTGTSTGSGTFGINAIDLRGLGQVRTLVLLDGQRTVASTFGGFIDVSTFPQDLVQRVEVVTGGASAQYGSDAVGGVVNFILDKEFKGLKLGADAGITTYGDGFNYRFTATAGHSFLDDRLHVLLNGEYFKQKGIDTIDRAWNNTGFQMTQNPLYTPTNGQPEFFVGAGIGLATRHRGGIINSGPLMGTYFLEDGVTKQLNYGLFNSISNPFMIGGDWQEGNKGSTGTTSLVPDEKRNGIFSRISFDVTPDITVYGQFSWNRYQGRANAWNDWGDVTIQADNAYLLTQYPQVAAAMQANGLSTIRVGHANPAFGPGGPDNRRDVFRYTAGAEGKLALFDRPWSWDLYLHHGVTKAHEATHNVRNLTRYALATDAVFSNGQIVCRSTLTDSGNGCVPLDQLGTGAPSDEALAYLFGPEQPWREQTIKLDVGSLVLNGQLFDLPGGPIAVAFGGEWRKEKINGRVGDPANYSWSSGNYRVNRGNINVKEAFLELSLPVFDGFNLDAAGRLTDYSTSGLAKTWKVGATYSPIADVKFRGAYSHDIRAPNMQELFQVGGIGLNQVVLPANAPTPGPVSIFGTTSGNPDLDPERANTATAGVVLTPRFLPGFSASADYYDIRVKDAIGTVTLQQVVDFCYSGVTAFCDSLDFTNGELTGLRRQPVNFAGQHMKGIDFEVSYRTPLSAISSNLPGDFSIHAAASHQIKNVVDNRTFPVDLAGVIDDGGVSRSGARPSWTYRVSAFYEIDPVTINLVARGFNSGVYSNEWIECTSNCPTSTAFNRTINNNHIDGALYFDGSVSWKIPHGGNESALTFVVRNILNRDPTPFAQPSFGDWITNPEAARPLYDALGRTFRVAFTSRF